MKIYKNRINEIRGKFVNKNMILYSPNANFFGQESKKTRQIRGNGVLILLEHKNDSAAWLVKDLNDLIGNIKYLMEAK